MKRRPPSTSPRRLPWLRATAGALVGLAVLGCQSDSESPDPAGTGGDASLGADALETGASEPGEGASELSQVLVFTRTTGFRHAAIEPGVEALTALGRANDFTVTQTEEPSDFTDDNLAQYDVVVWLCTSEEVLDEAGQAAFERYIQGGGGWVGVHSAADTEYDWPWYGQLIGGDAWFLVHPPGTPIATLTVDAETAEHPSVQHLPSTFDLQDEWYNFQNNPTASVNVLLRLDESSYPVGEGAMGADHPIAWFHEFDGGRAWYTGIGHRPQMYGDERFTNHLLGGLQWAAGIVP